MIFRNVFSQVLLIGLTTLPAAADQVRATLLSGSEALVTHFLSQPGLPIAAYHQLQQFEEMQGYGPETRTGGLTYFRVRPLLSYDPNVTGGVPNDSIQVAGFDFSIDPEFVGKGDMLLGVDVRAGLRKNLAPRLALDARASGSFGYAPRVEVSKASLDADLCLRYQSNRSRYIHGCVGADVRLVELGDQRSLRASTGITQAFTTGSTIHAVTGELGLRKVFPEFGTDWTQAYLRLSTASALRNGTAIVSMLELGEAVDRVHATRLRASIGLARDINGKPGSISLFYSKADGGIYLGGPRRDETIGLAVSYQFNEKLTLTGTLSQTSSNAQLFDSGPKVGLGIQVRF
jgi:hypothetical protein